MKSASEVYRNEAGFASIISQAQPAPFDQVLNFADAPEPFVYGRPHSTPIDYDGINAAALPRLPDLLKRWLPSGRRQGREWVARNPTRDDRKPGSFSINLDTGEWSDFATGDKGGDPIGLYAYLQRIQRHAAALHLAELLVMDARAPAPLVRPGARLPSPAMTSAVHQDDDLVPLPVPPDCAPPDWRPKLGRCSARWEYRGADGVLQGYMCRFDTAEGKDFRPLRYGRYKGREDWHWKGWGNGRPLYGLPDLIARPGVPVLVVEGEKTADAAKVLFADFVAVSPMNGAQSPGKTDWSPLAGRDVVIWPDHDEAGRDFALAVAGHAKAAGARPPGIVIVPEHLPEKWDLADPLPDELSEADLRVWIGKAASAGPPYERQGTFLVAHHWFTWSDGERRGPGVYEVVKGQNPALKEVHSSAFEAKGLADGALPIEVEVLRKICSELDILAETRTDAGDGWGRLLEITTRDGQRHQWAMPMQLLAGDGKEVRQRLADLGLSDLGSGKKARDALNSYLNQWRTKERARCVDRVGWHGPAFVLPDATFGDTGGERVVLQDVGARPQFAMAGSLDGWRREVAAPAHGNSRLALALCAAFAGPLIHLIGEESGGVHLHGGSSIGKTTAAQVARSAWGTQLGSWRTTDNGAEGLARGACDTLLTLDEIGQGDPKAIEAMAYLLGNGHGKTRAKVDGTARPAATWRSLFLSTGEVPLGTKLAEGGKRAMAGQAVRCLEIPADAGNGFGIFDHRAGQASGDALSRCLKAAVERQHGHAGRAFLERLTRDPNASDQVRRKKDELAAAWAPAGSDGQVTRAAGRFAMLAAAGELATIYGILPWQPGDAERDVKRCFQDWLAARGGHGPREEAEAEETVRLFLEQHGASRFQELKSNVGGHSAPEVDKIYHRAGYRKQEVEEIIYYFLPQVWKDEVCRGLDAAMVARVLLERGWLLKGEGNKLQKKISVAGEGKLRTYAVSSAIIGHEEG